MSTTHQPTEEIRLWRVSCLGLAIVLLVAVGRLEGQTPPVLTVDAPSGWTSISGDAGLVQTRMQLGPGWVLSGVGFGDRRDRPCYVWAAFSRQVDEAPGAAPRASERADDGVRTEVESMEERVCQGGSETLTSRRYLNLSGEGARAIHGIAVCQQASNDRIKGVRILGSTIGRDGPRRDAALGATEQRSECDAWNDAALCPSGEVAVALRVEFRGESAVGLSLRCAPARLEAGQ